MKFFGFICLFILLASCSDFSKGDQLEAINNLNKTVDSIETVLIENNMDEINEISIEAESVISRIKENIKSDTLEISFAEKIDDYLTMYKSIEPLGEIYNTLRKNIKAEKIALIKLERDIDHGNGERSKYSDFINFESKKINNLTKVLVKYISKRKKMISIYSSYHEKLYVYSFNLITK